MNRTQRRILAGAIASGVFATGVGIAQAGHLNRLLEGDLDGRTEVSASGSNAIAGDPDGRGEAYVFGIDNDVVDGVTTDNSDTLCYVLVVDKIAELDLGPGNGRAAHIHRGVEGENGPVVANLAWPQGGQAADCLSEDETGKFVSGTGAGIVQEVLTHPERFYVNVHNTEHPGGALRAQLSAQDH